MSVITYISRLLHRGNIHSIPWQHRCVRDHKGEHPVHPMTFVRTKMILSVVEVESNSIPVRGS